jgi:hypothetical protein
VPLHRKTSLHLPRGRDSLKFVNNIDDFSDGTFEQTAKLTSTTAQAAQRNAQQVHLTPPSTATTSCRYVTRTFDYSPSKFTGLFETIKLATFSMCLHRKTSPHRPRGRDSLIFVYNINDISDSTSELTARNFIDVTVNFTGLYETNKFIDVTSLFSSRSTCSSRSSRFITFITFITLTSCSLSN